MDPREGMTGRTFSARLHRVRGNANANDLRTQTNAAGCTCCYAEPRVRVQQGLEGPTRP